MGEICLIRHGQASFGAGNYDRLSEMGLLQSQILAGHLNVTGYRPSRIISGPLERHRSTASAVKETYMAHGIDLPQIEIMEEFREYDAKAIIMETVRYIPSLKELVPKIYEDPESFRKLFSASMHAWVTESLDFKGIESFADLKKRVLSGMNRILELSDRGERAAVFTSGGPIVASLANALGISGVEAMKLNWQIVNTSVTRYVYDRDTFILSGFNSIAHLRMVRDSTLITWY